MKRDVLAWAALVVLACGAMAGCAGNETIVCRTSYQGFEGFPPNLVTPQQALAAAAPHLDDTFALRTKGRASRSHRKPFIVIALKGRYYHVVKESAYGRTPDFYLDHAVLVHKDTGEVIPPY